MLHTLWDLMTCCSGVLKELSLKKRLLLNRYWGFIFFFYLFIFLMYLSVIFLCNFVSFHNLSATSLCLIPQYQHQRKNLSSLCLVVDFQERKLKTVRFSLMFKDFSATWKYTFKWRVSFVFLSACLPAFLKAN